MALERHALQAALRRQGAAVQALRSRFPELRELVESLHECRYADFLKSLAWVSCFNILIFICYTITIVSQLIATVTVLTLITMNIKCMLRDV